MLPCVEFFFMFLPLLFSFLLKIQTVLNNEWIQLLSNFSLRIRWYLLVDIFYVNVWVTAMPTFHLYRSQGSDVFIADWNPNNMEQERDKCLTFLIQTAAQTELIYWAIMRGFFVTCRLKTLKKKWQLGKNVLTNLQERKTRTGKSSYKCLPYTTEG